MTIAATIVMVTGGVCTFTENRTNSVISKNQNQIEIPSSLQSYVSNNSTNLSNELNLLFIVWYSENVNSSLTTLFQLNAQQLPLLFHEFIARSPSGADILNEIISEKVQVIQQREEQTFESIDKNIQTGNLSGMGTIRSPSMYGFNTNQIYLNSSNLCKVVILSLPGSGDEGVYFILSFSPIIGNFILFKEKVGEVDAWQVEYEGNDAQAVYSTIKSGLTNSQYLDFIFDIISATTGALISRAFGSPGTTALMGIATAVVVAAGETASLVAGSMKSQLTSLYDSTYANKNSGDKYLLLGANLVYFYSWYSSDSFLSLYGVNAARITEYFVACNPLTISTTTFAIPFSTWWHNMELITGLNSWYKSGDPD